MAVAEKSIIPERVDAMMIDHRVPGESFPSPNTELKSDNDTATPRNVATPVSHQIVRLLVLIM